MKITNIRTGKLEVPLRKPFKTALRTVNSIISTIIEVETDQAVIGVGEAHPTGPITGETHSSVRGAIFDYILPAIKGKSIDNIDRILSVLNSCCIGNSSAKAAIDMAVYDLFGKYYQIPLFRLFGGNSNKIATNLTISINSPEEMVAASLEAVSRGFNILKVKVGIDAKLDIERILAIRKAVGANVAIRLDANQGWTARQAQSVMNRIEAENIDIELLEQPVKARDFAGMKQITQSIQTPVLADESVFSALDAQQIITMGAADYINIKLMKCGGLRQALQICSVAEINNVECFMGCMLETKVAVTAAAHLACGKSVITRCDLDSPALCTCDPVIGGAKIEGSFLQLSDLPGLGIEKIEGVIWD